jgi:hypothetical protein
MEYPLPKDQAVPQTSNATGAHGCVMERETYRRQQSNPLKTRKQNPKFMGIRIVQHHKHVNSQPTNNLTKSQRKPTVGSTNLFCALDDYCAKMLLSRKSDQGKVSTRANQVTSKQLVIFQPGSNP